MVFVRRADGTAAMYVTSASGVPHEVTGGDGSAALYADGVGGALTLYREVPDAPATALARSGTPVSVDAIPNGVLNATMFFRVLSATPLTGLQLGGLTLSNGPVQAFITQHASDAPRTFQGQLAESGALAAQGGGHRATFAGGVTLQPGTLYGLRLGNSQGGVAPQVQLASTATYTGQGWSGLILDPYLRWYANGGAMGEASYATAAETPAFDVLFEVPTVVTPDEALLTVRAGAGLAAEVTGPEINLRAALNLSQYGATPDQVTHAWTPGSTSGVSGQPGYRFRYTTSGPLMISGLNVALPAGRTLKLRTGGVTYTATTTSGGVTFNPPVQVVGGAFELDIDTLGGSYPSGSNLIAGATTTDGLITIVSVAQLDGAGAEMGSPGTTGGLNAGVLSGLPVVFGQLPQAAVQDLPELTDQVTTIDERVTTLEDTAASVDDLSTQVSTLTGTASDHATRLTALEGRTNLDTEQVQDIVGQMFGGTQGSYDDAAGTYAITFPAGTTISDEQIQDIVGAFVQAGSNVTVTYDDATNKLTIASVGGSSGPSLPSRTTASVTTASLAPGASGQVTLSLARGYALYRITASATAWVRVYRDPDARSADSSRNQTTDPQPGAGVTAEMIGATATWDQAVMGFDGKGSPDGQIPLAVTNLSGSAQTITITALYVPTEA